MTSRDGGDGAPTTRAGTVVPRWVLLAVGLLGMSHALVYVFSVPPWGLEDEQQHVDYVLALRDSHDVPRIDQYVHPEITASAIATDRAAALGLGTAPPPDTPPSALGLEGMSYEGHQPPLYYALMVPFVAPLGNHVLDAMYALRLVNAVLVGVLAALAAMLAASWAMPGRATVAAAFAGVAVAAVPAIAEAGARASNDLMVTVLITATALACTRLLKQPTMRNAWVVGGTACAAVMTKTTGLIALVAVGGTLAVVDWQRTPRVHPVRGATACLAPSIVGAGAWALVTHARYGVWSGDSAFLQLQRPFTPLPFGEMLARTLRQAAVPIGPWPKGTWDLPLALCILFAVAMSAGVALALMDRRARLLAAGALLMGAALALGYLWELRRGLVTVSARLLVPSYPALLAAAACGYVALRPQWVWRTIVTVGVVCAIAFFVLEFSPQFPFRVG